MPENSVALADLALIREAALEGARIAMGYFQKDPEVWYKNGTSPVTEADIAVDRFLRDSLCSARSDYGWLSEETEDDRSRLDRQSVFVVDPIDGTRAFVHGEDMWCVSIAVVRSGEVQCGVLACPARGEVFEASIGAASVKDGAPLRIDSTRDQMVLSMPKTLFKHLPEGFVDRITRSGHIPSLAYRIAMVADGRLDGTLVKPNSHDWDLAAADLILRNAGGALLDRKGSQICYNKSDVSHGLLIAGSGDLLSELGNVARSIDL
ncbi:3'(2'),5'-bisphosphate nucleotidase CysQ [Hoeflea prorocentri]|uniref:3'(2'),5'-bisphosphate nucleotidase CysQ n=1 Tax=Hoeflea prorocentri TaxID=1922333 RepID=A0A9X3UNE5_9HYPH|nr:3'(2'),5'-bisphosphate nucleotidase CysQ [Hoeflea prorocentri]MCY6382251.1 3'(2'),5'-bisphosphate nucleotidase CysQ [Hoeflea prorocentri]MDA5400051.1 3'(2'),5'-bisphosphate nucleotidase CysQ [Hoeflea prorocentri]